MKYSFVKVILPDWTINISDITQQTMQAYLVAPLTKIDDTETLHKQKVKHNLCAMKLQI